MTKSISQINLAKASTAKPSIKNPPGDKTLDLGTATRFYEIEDVDNTEEGEE